LGWAIWPVWTLLSLLGVHALHHSGRVDGFGAHLLITVLAGAELVVTAFLIEERSELLFVMGYWLVGVAIHAMHRYGRPSLLNLHLALFIGVNSLLVLQSLYQGETWFTYPLAAWSVILAAHLAIHVQAGLSGARTWEPAMLAHLASENEATARTVRRKSFLFHLSLFAVGIGALAAIGALAYPGGGWIVWPASVWLVFAIAHLGVLAMPKQPLLGLDILGGLAASLWLLVLDANTAGGPWWFWPVAGWLALLAMHGGIMLLPRHPYLAVWLGFGLVVSLSLVVTDRATAGGSWWYWPVGAFVMASVVAIPLSIDLLGIVARQIASSDHSRDLA
jgi:hypothetical protein